MTPYEIELRVADLIEEKRYQDAFGLLLPIADNGSEFTLMTLGWLLSNDVIAENNNHTAMEYHYRAARKGNRQAFIAYGKLLLDEGLASEALMIFEEGAELGSFACKYWLGSMLIDGNGGVADEPSGVSWLKQAADSGHLYAQRDLLVFEFRKEQSLFSKASIALKIGCLALKVGKETIMEKNSEKIR
ncbi:MAG: hypothetical protein ABJO01_00040 [Parasphingorhabdus sp.]|uniref:tetratricopeptide repeat protein n=1 Tax=Parasphingorhabdus sp. TaxID=2709688 RepID=UPI003296F98D